MATLAVTSHHYATMSCLRTVDLFCNQRRPNFSSSHPVTSSHAVSGSGQPTESDYQTRGVETPFHSFRRPNGNINPSPVFHDFCTQTGGERSICASYAVHHAPAEANVLVGHPRHIHRHFSKAMYSLQVI